MSVCMCLGVISGFLLFVETKGAQFCHYYISGLGETSSYNGVNKIGLIILNWSFLFGVLPVDSKQRISFAGSGAEYGILLIGQRF